MSNEELSAKQLLFVEAYNGNATEAALKAGYSPKTAESQGCRLLKNVKVAEAIRARQDKAIAPLVASRQDRQKFWTGVMNDKFEKMPDRLKASELLGKSEGDFLERVNHSGSIVMDKVFSEAAGDGE